MALQITFPDPYGVDNLPAAYARIVQVNLNFADEFGLIVINVYASRAAANANKPPTGQLTFTITPVGVPATQAITDAKGNVITPANPGFPSFNQILADAVLAGGEPAGALIFDMTRTFLYNLIKNQPQFKGALNV